MSKCVNEKCKNDPMRMQDSVLATPDGDFACCKKCLEEFKKQRENFFNNIGNDAWYKNYIHMD